jgi:hypothetical protein
VPSLLDDICLACLPADALATLADLRSSRQIEVAVVRDRAWVRWPVGDQQTAARMLAVKGSSVFRNINGLWYRPGCRLPSFDVREDQSAQPLADILFPAPVAPEPAPAESVAPVALRLVRDDRMRRTTGMRCALDRLVAWADRATTDELTAVRGTVTGDRALLVGGQLPAVAGAERFWGNRVLVPLGHRLEPELPDSALRDALGLADQELAVVDQSGAEIVPDGALRRLTRAGVRLARRSAV